MFHFRKTKQEVCVIDFDGCAFRDHRRKVSMFFQVVVRLVAREQASLDMVEITFKEQYISRGDLWRCA